MAVFRRLRALGYSYKKKKLPTKKEMKRKDSSSNK
jgi:hypothetical protein